MKTVVTGSHGFVGSWLCKNLALPLTRQFDIILDKAHDVTLRDVRKKIVQDTDCIIHLAGVSGVNKCEKDEKNAFLVNAEATIELAKEAKRAGVNRFIFASSASVYGEAGQYLIDEVHPTSPRNVYGRTKLAAERIIQMNSHDFRVVILRKSNVYGFGTMWKGITVIDQFLEKYIANQPISIQGTGGQKRDFVHIQDVVRTYAQIATAKKVRSGIYNIGGLEPISLDGLANMINLIGQSIFGYRSNIEYTPDIVNGVNWHDFKYDWSKARMEFQYYPVFTLDDYIKERLMLEMRNRCGNQA